MVSVLTTYRFVRGLKRPITLFDMWNVGSNFTGRENVAFVTNQLVLSNPKRGSPKKRSNGKKEKEKP